ncbi:cbf5 [Nucleospora cyclopteri]
MSVNNNYNNFVTKDTSYSPSGCGNSPKLRKISEYLKYGIVHIDKPSNPSSHEVTTWVKEILQCEKTGHAGTLDPSVTGVLTVCMNRATRLAKSQQSAGKEYICTIEFTGEVKKITKKEFDSACYKMTGHMLQRPPLLCAVKRELRLRWIYSIQTIEFKDNIGLFRVKCEAGSYIRTLCVHIGLILGQPAVMKDLRRIKSGEIEEEMCVTLQDLQDAFYMYKKHAEEKYLRKVVQPLESLLVSYKKIVIKDSAVNAVCYGAPLTAKGVYKYDPTIETSDTVVLITAKGEAVALGNPLVNGMQLKDLEEGVVVKLQRVIMEKDLYPKNWGIGKEYEIYGENDELLEVLQ